MLAPPRAGDRGLAEPTYYARIDLSQRAPTMLRLDLPKGRYYVAPASLGYFGENNEFVYTADVGRGLIYGRRYEDSSDAAAGKGPIYIVELYAPGESRPFIDEYLKSIRERVSSENLAQNQLRIAREQADDEPLKLRRLAAQPLRFSSQELAQQAMSNWASQVCNDYADLLSAMPGALQSETLQESDLKRLYYRAEAAGLDQLISTYELQMNLARLPRPQIENLLSLGDDKTVQNSVMLQVKRLRSGWQDRERELRKECELLEDWMAKQPAGRTPSPSADSGVTLFPKPALGLLGAAPRDAIIQAAAAARLSVSRTELRELEQIQTLAAGLQHYVEAGKVSGERAIRYGSLARSQFKALEVETLPRFGEIEGLAAQPDPPLTPLLELTRAFEGLADPARISLTASYRNLDAKEREVAYGLLLADRALRLGQPVNTAPSEADTEGELEAALSQKPQVAALPIELAHVLATPGDYDMADCSLGFLAFISWYSDELAASDADALSSGWEDSSPAEAQPSGAADAPKRSAGGSGRQPR